ncbi:MAG: DapH/DapD/GlmU-related protein [Desulfobacteraceae bacterium]|jgi:acetyltransferase-like isoleucine patch superfamily enzyme|nr:DapH/DapD/GlmU-related protein [Desulfobacteraceae bacterium]
MEFKHPTATLSKNVRIGKNVFIGPNCIIGFPGFQFSTSVQNEVKDHYTEIGDNSIVMGNSVICLGAKIDNNCRFDYHSYIGEKTLVGKYSVIEYGARVYDNVKIGEFCTISGFICNNSIIGENSIAQGDLLHKFKDVTVSEIEKSPEICKNVFVGRRALIIGGIKVAEGCYIAAGSVLTKNTEANIAYSGNPAQKNGRAPKSYIEGVSNFNKQRIENINEVISSYSWA